MSPDIFQVQSENIAVYIPSITNVFGFDLTSSTISGLLVSFAIIVFCVYFRLAFKASPHQQSKFKVAMEWFYESAYSLISVVTGDAYVAKKILPIILTVLIYITLSNLLLLVPGLSSLSYDGTLLVTPHTRDFSVTFAIAFAVVIWSHFMGVQQSGPLGYLGRFIRVVPIIKGFGQGIGSGMLAIVDFFVGLLDFVSEIAKSLSLSLRLFGNMFAGEILAALVLGVFALLLPIPIIIYSIFVGLLQALVFAALTTSYFGLTLKEE